MALSSSASRRGGSFPHLPVSKDTSYTHCPLCRPLLPPRMCMHGERAEPRETFLHDYLRGQKEQGLRHQHELAKRNEKDLLPDRRVEESSGCESVVYIHSAHAGAAGVHEERPRRVSTTHNARPYPKSSREREIYFHIRSSQTEVEVWCTGETDFFFEETVRGWRGSIREAPQLRSLVSPIIAGLAVITLLSSS